MTQGLVASGTNSFIGFAPQVGADLAAQWIHAYVTSAKFLPILNFSGGLEQETGRRNDLTNAATARGWWKGPKKAKFATSHLLDYAGHEQLLKRAFGASASALNGGSTGAYVHTFTLASTKIAASVECCLDSTLTYSSLRYPSNIITAVEFEFNLFDPIKVTYEWLGIGQDAIAAPATPTFPADDLVVPTNIADSTGAFIKVSTVAYKIIKGKVRVEDPMNESGHYIGPVLSMCPPGRVEQRKVTGEITFEFDQTDAVTLYELYRSLAEATLEVKYPGALIDTGQYRYLDLNVWRIVPTGKTPEVGGPSIVECTIPFEGFYDVANARDAVGLTLQNTTVHTSGSPIL
jgi:hypothetical protein